MNPSKKPSGASSESGWDIAPGASSSTRPRSQHWPTQSDVSGFVEEYHGRIDHEDLGDLHTPLGADAQVLHRFLQLVAQSRRMTPERVDQIAQGMGGLMSVTGLPGQGPVRAGLAVADSSTGLYLALGIMAALLERERSGEGQWVHASLLHSQIAMMDFQIGSTNALHVKGLGLSETIFGMMLSLNGLLIIIFELTMLGAILATVIGLIVLSPVLLALGLGSMAFVMLARDQADRQPGQCERCRQFHPKDSLL